MKKILIIDDQPEICQLLARAVETFGYEHQMASDGHTAIALCRSWKPDIILTDIFMPEKDGLEVIREIRKLAFGAPVIAMSGGGSAGDLDVLRTARLMGAKRVLAKPFPMHELKTVLRELSGGDDGDRDQSGISDSAGAGPDADRNA